MIYVKTSLIKSLTKFVHLLQKIEHKAVREGAGSDNEKGAFNSNKPVKKT